TRVHVLLRLAAICSPHDHERSSSACKASPRRARRECLKTRNRIRHFARLGTDRELARDQIVRRVPTANNRALKLSIDYFGHHLNAKRSTTLSFEGTERVESPGIIILVEHSGDRSGPLAPGH